MLGITLTRSQERAVRRLIGFLDEAAACYQFSGGFAGNLHGSRWPLHDLDLDLHVWVQPLDALIAYKTLIGRAADVAELRALQSRLRE